MRSIFAAVALSVMMGGTASSEDVPTGYDLMMNCKSAELWRQTACTNYLLGIWEGFDQGIVYTLKVSGFCSHGAVQAGQLQLIYLKWAAEHPERLGMPRANAALLSFIEAFPCSATR